MLTVTDSSGLQSSQFVTIFPDKVNLTFDTAPGGLTLYLDGIAHTAPFVYDTLKGFNHTIEARDQTVGTTSYTFASWTDGGTQQHTLVVPDAAQTYTATFNVATAPAPLAFVQANAATPQTNQTQVSVAYTSAQVAGDTNILVIGWNNATSNITSVTDTAGNIYQLAVPTVRGSGISQAIYYAKNIKSAAAGTNTVTVTFNTATRTWTSALWNIAASIWPIRSMSALPRQAPAIRRTAARLRPLPLTNSSSEPERRLVASRQQAAASPLASSLRPTQTLPKTGS